MTDPGFPRCKWGGGLNLKGVPKPIIWLNFPDNCLNTKLWGPKSGSDVYAIIECSRNLLEMDLYLGKKVTFLLQKLLKSQPSLNI